MRREHELILSFSRNRKYPGAWVLRISTRRGVTGRALRLPATTARCRQQATKINWLWQCWLRIYNLSDMEIRN